MSKACRSSRPSRATRIPLPPPPADALRITGKPISSASLTAASRDVSGSGEPGRIGTPRADTVRRAVALSPISRIASGGGPIHTTPHSWTTSAKWAFSARNPYPGWIASAPVISAAEITEVMFRYDALANAGPMHTASSAMRTWSESRSASEWTATVARPSSLQAAMMRSAISPRFAIRTLEIIAPQEGRIANRRSPNSTACAFSG